MIPGLDYFAWATKILGGQLAGTGINYVHANLLAGLYHGQLGRPVESARYINRASHGLQSMLQ